MQKKQKNLKKTDILNSSKAYFKLVSDAELKEILKKNKNLIQTKEVKSEPLPIIGIANCNK